jgi:transmembrane sensor
MRDGNILAREEPLPPQVIAEAGVWIARINGPNSESAKRGLRRWLAEAKAHQRAFMLATDVWDEAGSLRGCAVAHLIRAKPLTQKLTWAHALMSVAAAGTLAIGGSFLLLHHTGVTTVVGERRVVTLEDGSRILLNTSTRLFVKYDKYARHVELENGEALFDVLKNPRRPFVVTAGGREVTALGTSFEVRRDGADVMVTLIEGKVTVTPVAEATGRSPATQVEVLSPGQRLTFAVGRAPRLDRPQLEKVTAWQRGQVSLDNLSLADAVAEMNRYSTMQLRIERPEAAALRVSGIFRAGDSGSFARAVSETYGLVPIEQASAILLTGLPTRQSATAALDGSDKSDLATRRE